MKTEIWKPVVGMEPWYLISNLGRVRSKHVIGRPTRNHIKSLDPNKKGYLRVHLTGGGKCFTIVVHRLVLEAFVGPQPSVIHQTNHKNGVKADNRIENLEWVTPVENNRHARATGLWHPNLGEAHGMARLKESDIPTIRKLEGKEGPTSIGRRYGVSGTCISLIWKRINWKHIK